MRHLLSESSRLRDFDDFFETGSIFGHRSGVYRALPDFQHWCFINIVVYLAPWPASFLLQWSSVARWKPTNSDITDWPWLVVTKAYFVCILSFFCWSAMSESWIQLLQGHRKRGKYTSPIDSLILNCVDLMLEFFLSRTSRKLLSILLAYKAISSIDLLTLWAKLCGYYTRKWPHLNFRLQLK